MRKPVRLLTVTAALLLAACAGPRATRAYTLSADSPEAAVRMSVESRGGIYAGDCAAAVSPGDTGKVCSKLAGERQGTRAYLVGRTFSEFGGWVFVAPDGDGWTVTATAPLDFFAGADVPWP